MPNPLELSADPCDDRTWLTMSRRFTPLPENDIARLSKAELAAPGGRGDSCVLGNGRECVDSIDLREERRRFAKPFSDPVGVAGESSGLSFPIWESGLDVSVSSLSANSGILTPHGLLPRCICWRWTSLRACGDARCPSLPNWYYWRTDDAPRQVVGEILMSAREESVSLTRRLPRAFQGAELAAIPVWYSRNVV